MGTEVMYPQDFLRSSRSPVILSPSSSSSSFVPRLKPQKTHGYSNPKTRSNFVGSPNPNPNPNNRYGRKAAEGGKKKVMGDVVILKRGESLDDKTSKSLLKEKKKGGSETGRDGILSSPGCVDRIVFNTECLGPDSITMPKELCFEGVYAGSTCAASPSPSALPLPTFSIRRETCASAADAVSATNDLRRILGLA